MIDLVLGYCSIAVLNIIFILKLNNQWKGEIHINPLWGLVWIALWVKIIKEEKQ